MIQVISATEARNNFFSILDESFLKKKKFLIKKGNIPIAYIGPLPEVYMEKDDILEKIKQFKKKVKKGGNSVLLIRQLRNEN